MGAITVPRKKWRALLVLAMSILMVYAVSVYQHRLVRRVAPKTLLAACIVDNARVQIGTHYDGTYHVIVYPSGDLPRDRGACTDVVIRAARGAGMDLQQFVHEDMAMNRALYPRYRSKELDTNIDHRRVPNLACYLSRHTLVLTRDTSASALAEWQPGDIVCWKTIFGRDHIGVISDGLDPGGVPFVIHSEYGGVEENCLTRWKILGHYRFVTEIRSTNSPGPTNPDKKPGAMSR